MKRIAAALSPRSGRRWTIPAAAVIAAVAAIAVAPSIATSSGPAAQAAWCQGPNIAADGRSVRAQCGTDMPNSSWFFFGVACGPSYCRSFTSPRYPQGSAWYGYTPGGYIAEVHLGA